MPSVEEATIESFQSKKFESMILESHPTYPPSVYVMMVMLLDPFVAMKL